MTQPVHSPHPELDGLSVSLFQLFSRLEYALKAAGYLITENGKAAANWDRFAADIGPTLAMVGSVEFENAKTYLLNHPPKSQVVRNALLDWEETLNADLPEPQRLFTFVRRVRNNLFHGGKFNGHWFEPQRSKELLEASLVVLETALQSQPAVNQAFFE